MSEVVGIPTGDVFVKFHLHFCKTFAAREYLLSGVLYNS